MQESYDCSGHKALHASMKPRLCKRPAFSPMNALAFRRFLCRHNSVVSQPHLTSLNVCGPLPGVSLCGPLPGVSLWPAALDRSSRCSFSSAKRARVLSSLALCAGVARFRSFSSFFLTYVPWYEFQGRPRICFTGTRHCYTKPWSRAPLLLRCLGV